MKKWEPSYVYVCPDQNRHQGVMIVAVGYQRGEYRYVYATEPDAEGRFGLVFERTHRGETLVYECRNVSTKQVPECLRNGKPCVAPKLLRVFCHVSTTFLVPASQHK